MRHAFGQVLLASTLLGAAQIPTADAAVPPLLETEWGQDGVWAEHTPLDADGNPTYTGCTTVAAAQVLAYYGFRNSAKASVEYGLDHDVTGPDIEDGGIYIDLPSYSYDFSRMAATDGETRARTQHTSQFLYHVAVTLNAQFGDASGSPATAKQLENAFRYQWGYNQISRRQMSVIAKEAFGYTDDEWADVIRAELDAGRPVIYMAEQADANAGHAFVIDGYRDDGMVHVNWGWGGYANGYFDPNTLQDPRGRRWNRQAMIFRGLEPATGHARDMLDPTPHGLTWAGTGSLISASSGSQKGYGLTQDEVHIGDTLRGTPTALFQWEVDPADGTRLAFDATTGGNLATITYGIWSDRSKDVTHHNVRLPFVIDPAADNFSPSFGEYFVFAVQLEGGAHGEGSVTAEITKANGSASQPIAAQPIVIDGKRWNGNGSIISLSSGTLVGYGLTRDVAIIHDEHDDQVVYFQWELDARDGHTLHLDGEGLTVELSYGLWNGDREQDVTRTVTLPYVIDPKADGFASSDGEYFVIRATVAEAPSAPVQLEARAK